MFREVGNRRLTIAALRRLAEAQVALDDPAAPNTIEETLGLAVALDAPIAQAKLHSLNALYCSSKGWREKAFRALELARAIAIEVDNPGLQAQVWSREGLAVCRLGDKGRAADLLSQARKVVEGLDVARANDVVLPMTQLQAALQETR